MLLMCRIGITKLEYLRFASSSLVLIKGLFVKGDFSWEIFNEILYWKSVPLKRSGLLFCIRNRVIRVCFLNIELRFFLAVHIIIKI